MQGDKLLLKTPASGPRYLYSVNGKEGAIAEHGQTIVLEQGQRLQMNERHVQLELFPIPPLEQKRFVLLLREDFSSFGDKVHSSASAFQFQQGKMVSIPEAEGRTALEDARKKTPADK